MDVQQNIVVLLWTFLCVCFLSALTPTLYKLWWTPLAIQRTMAAQGIKGPPYKFIYGSTKELLRLKKEATITPMADLSHNTFAYLQPHVSTWTKTYGDIYVSWIGHRAQLTITKPELVKEVLNNKNKAFPKPKPGGYMAKLLGNALVTTEGDQWAMKRKLANHAFHGDSLKKMIPAMVDSVHMMLQRWRDQQGNEVEVFNEFTFLTSEVISRTAFGSSYVEGRKIFEMLRKLLLIVSRNAIKIRFPGISKLWKTNDDLESEKLECSIRNAVLEIIRRREAKMDTGDASDFENDFLGLLVKAYRSKDKSMKITMDDLVDECKTFYAAGQETTSSMLTWTVFLLAVHTDWQEEARKEVFEVLSDRDPDPDCIAKLKIIGMIINESLRLYPPAIGVIRTVNKRVQLGMFSLPPSIQLYIPNLKHHHDPQIWGDDAHRFKPDGFSEGVAKATNNNITAFFPFGLGPRTCVGVNFALSEAKVALLMILQRYSFSLSPNYVHSLSQMLTIRPLHGVQVILHPL